MPPPCPTPSDASLPPRARVLNLSARNLWHKSAPKTVRRAFTSGNHADGWNAWKRHLARRKRPADPAILLPGNSEPLHWALPEAAAPRPARWASIASAHTPHLRAWLSRAKKLPHDRLPAGPSFQRDLLCWLHDSAAATSAPGKTAIEAAYALEALACCRAIARWATVLSPQVWWALLDHLLATVADAQGIPLDESPLVHQLLAGELALTLAYLLPEITPCRKLKSSARRCLSSALVDLLDGEGLPHAKHLALFGPLLACWTRCAALGDGLKGGCWTRAAANQYGWLVRQALRLLRPDSTPVFSHDSTETFSQELFAAALRLGGDQHDHAIAKLVLPRAKKALKRRAGQSALPQPAYDSEWAAAAVLRPQWSRLGPRLTVLYPRQQLRIELSCGKDVLWSGPWDWDVRTDGQPALPQSPWQQLCWFSDHDVDFLELEMRLSGGLRLQRHMLLARQDHFLLLADVVLGATPRRLQYRGRLPLCPGVSFRGADQSREGFLVGTKRRALVLPLALPEWRADRRVGRLVQTSKGLELRQSTRARRLYAPLFLDLDRRRLTRPATWRQLTVAQSLAVQPDEVAVGYRVAVGKQQWLIYRSLAPPANRTLLGHNLSTELLVAQFHRTGKVEPLLEIE